MLGPEGESGWQRGKDKMFLRNGVLEVLEAAMKVRDVLLVFTHPRVCLVPLLFHFLQAFRCLHIGPSFAGIAFVFKT